MSIDEIKRKAKKEGIPLKEMKKMPFTAHDDIASDPDDEF